MCLETNTCRICHRKYQTKKPEHHCMQFFCKTCAMYVPRDEHRCLMKPLTTPVKPFHRYIHFDFETITDDNGDLNVCLAVARVSCGQCADQQEACSLCAPRWHVFYGDRSIAEFVSFFFTGDKKWRRCLFLAHAG